MRIALFNVDCLATNRVIFDFIRNRQHKIVLVGLSKKAAPGLMQGARRHIAHSGFQFTAFMFVNYVLPRWMATLPFRNFTSDHQSISQLCTAMGIHVIPVANVNAPEIHTLLRDMRIDLILSCYFDQIFDQETLSIAKFGAINVHTSMLPNHRGPMPIVHGLSAQPPSLGVSIHRVDNGIDTGAVLAQESYDASPSQSVIQITTALHRHGLILINDLSDAIGRGTTTEILQKGGSYERFPSRDMIRTIRQRGYRLFDMTDLRAAMSIRIDI